MNMFLAKLNGLLAKAVELPGWLETLLSAVKKVIGPILIVAATAGVLYAIVVGVKFVKADTKEEREEAKQKLITVIVGVVVTLVLIVAFYWLAYAIENGQIQLDFWSDK